MRKQIFFAAVIIASVFFMSCNEEIAESISGLTGSGKEGKYNININIDADNLTKGASAHTSPTANKGQKLTLTVTPPVSIKSENENDNPIYYFVAPINGFYEDKDGFEKPFNGFKRSTKIGNEYTFTMPAGNLKINISFTNEVDKTSAFLRWVGVSVGSIANTSPLEYTVTVPHDTTEDFFISAQAENQDAGLILQAGSPGDGDNLFDTEKALTLNEGLNEYTITVTSQDENNKNEYKVRVIKLPDLSLKEFKLTNSNANFEQSLAPADTQTIYVPYTDITIVANAAGSDSGVKVNINPSEKISGILVASAKTAIVRVSKDLAGVEEEYRVKNYTLNLYYGDGMTVSPLASGGYASFIPSGSAGVFYEVHTFFTSGTLSFSDTSKAPTNVDYLIIGGGGGAGGGLWWAGAGGGGAGGLLYKTEQALTLAGGSVSVTVGAGGKGGGGNVDGNDGGASSIGDIKVPGGGGGGAGIDNNTARPGKPGGSGGGGGVGYKKYSGEGGKSSAANGVMGNIGGKGSYKMDGGGGGGGAGGAGDAGDAEGDPVVGAAGGKPWSLDGKSAWIKDVLGVNEFSRGGNGGTKGPYRGGAPGKNYGDGGSGGGIETSSGGMGREGIVVIRFQRSLSK